eukprot:g814.t1
MPVAVGDRFVGMPSGEDFVRHTRTSDTGQRTGALIKDYAKAANTVYELEQAVREMENINVLKRELFFLKEVGDTVRRRGIEDLYKGLREYNAPMLEQAAQAFYNLHTLGEEVLYLDALASDLASRLEELLKPLVARTPVPPGSAGVQQQNPVDFLLESFFLSASAVVKQVEFFSKQVLDNKADPVTHEKWRFNFFEKFWAKLFGEVFERYVRSSYHHSVLVSEFPHLAKRLQMHFLDVLDSSTTTSGEIDLDVQPGTSSTAANSYSLRKQLFATVEEVHNQFVQTSLTRVTEPVELMLSEKVLSTSAAGGGEQNLLPTAADVRRYVQILGEELKHCAPGAEEKENYNSGASSKQTSSSLHFVYASVVKNVRTSVLLFISRLEMLCDSEGLMVVSTAAGAGVGGAAAAAEPQFAFTPAHLRNARLFQLLSVFSQQLREQQDAQQDYTTGNSRHFVNLNLPPQLWSHLRATQQSLVDCFYQTVHIQFAQEFYGKWRAELLGQAGGAPGATSCSPSLERFVQYLTNVSKTYLERYGAPHLSQMQFGKNLLQNLLLRLLLGQSNFDAHSKAVAAAAQLHDRESLAGEEGAGAGPPRVLPLRVEVDAELRSKLLANGAGQYEQQMVAIFGKVLVKNVEKAKLLEHVQGDETWTQALGKFLEGA